MCNGTMWIQPLYTRIRHIVPWATLIKAFTCFASFRPICKKKSLIYKSTPKSLEYFTSNDFKNNKTLLESSIVLSTTTTQVNLWLNSWSVPLSLIIWLRESTNYIQIFNKGRHFYRLCDFIISNLVLLTINHHTVMEMF